MGRLAKYFNYYGSSHVSLLKMKSFVPWSTFSQHLTVVLLGNYDLRLCCRIGCKGKGEAWREREANNVVSYLIFCNQGQSGLNIKNMPLKAFPTFPAILAYHHSFSLVGLCYTTASPEELIKCRCSSWITVSLLDINPLYLNRNRHYWWHPL